MQKTKEITLAFKLNVLLTSIVLIVSAVLVSISYQSFTKTAYLPYEEKLDAMEANFTDDSDQFLKWVPYFYQATELEGFDQIRAEDEAQGFSGPLTDLLNQYTINLEEHRIVLIGEPEVRDDGQGGVSYIEQDSLTTVFDIFALGLVYGGSEAGIYHIQIVAEPEPGKYVNILEIGGSLEFMDWQRFSLGKRYDHVEAIELFHGQKDGMAFFHTEDERKELTKVLSAEREGLRIYVINSCDVTKTREAQNAFLRRSLLLVGLMVLAAIAVSLILLRRMATKPLKQLAEAVDRFDLDEEGRGREDVIELDIRSRDEIGRLYRNFRSMQTRIIDNAEHLTRMTAEKERIGTELALATRIQEDMLPSTFPPFPDRKEFDLYASMDPAKEVGGDFYDFFLVDEDHLALLIADVSGKGVPAALFMMVSKLLVQNIAKSATAPAKVLELANREICANNREDMFVTVWLGILELSTGRLTAASAGHEYPVLSRPGEDFAILKDRRGFVLGGMEGLRYEDYELVLEPGAKLFVYTDGVPEACDAKGEFFGSARMLRALNEVRSRTPQEILDGVRAAVEAFVGEAEQFDDMTMLCVEYRGPEDAAANGGAEPGQSAV